MPDPTQESATHTPSQAQPRKSSSPLLWILILIALLAFAWYFYNRQMGHADGTLDGPQPAASTDAMTPGTGASPEHGPPPKQMQRKPAKPAAEPIAKTPAQTLARNRDAHPLQQPRPAYPPEAARAREQGIVLVRASIDASGHPDQVGVAQRSGSRVLDRAAVDAVRQWTFAPAIKNGKAVASTVQVPVEFSLDALR